MGLGPRLVVGEESARNSGPYNEVVSREVSCISSALTRAGVGHGRSVMRVLDDHYLVTAKGAAAGWTEAFSQALRGFSVSVDEAAGTVRIGKAIRSRRILSQSQIIDVSLCTLFVALILRMCFARSFSS